MAQGRGRDGQFLMNMEMDSEIRFRAVEKEDLHLLKIWRNSESVRSGVREYRLLGMADQERWFENYQKSRRNSEWDQELMMIETEETKNILTPVGVGGFVRIEWRNRKTELSYYPSPAVKDEYLICESIFKLLEKGFMDFNFHKIYWPVYSHNPNLDLYRKILNEEAVLKFEYFWNGGYSDRHYLSLTESQFHEKFDKSPIKS